MCVTGSCSATWSIWMSTTTTSGAARCRQSPTSRRQAASEHPPGGVARRADAGEDAAHRTRPQQGLAAARRSCGPTTSGAGGSTTCGRLQGAGFRVPALLVSPYARRGVRRQHAARPHLDPEVHRGQLAARAAGRARRAGEQPRRRLRLRPARPREPRLIAADLRSASRGSPRRWLIYLLYGVVVMLAVGLIARVGSGARAQVPLVAVVALGVLGAASPRCARGGVAVGDPDRSGGPGHALRRERRPLRDRQRRTRLSAAAALAGSRVPIRALKTRIAPGVRVRFDRWYRDGRIAALNVDHQSGRRLRRPRGQARRPWRGQLGDARGQQWPAPVIRGRGAAVAPGQPGRSGERGTPLDGRLVRRRAGGRRRLDGRASRAAALLPRRGPPRAAAPPALLGPVRCSRRAARVPNRVRRAP